ncbi:transposase [Faecalicatena contorta]|uniref:Transposase n=1 Tax=Faecalicatena contorta TaxID=39482 RepID=A0A315ZS66_9FIRM|nr:transposase [Faecalicatena contorta]PWJ47973.1 transposase [Faecalicatena contorta]SUQ15736.1 Transposase [Faecalicatena contorta]
MMGKQDTQIQMVILNLDAMIPSNHLLRQIKNTVNFDFIYEKAAPYYASTGRKSIDPVVLFKMLLIGYLYGIKSERRLEEEVSLNLAYRWFCDLDLMQRVPDHSTISQNRRRKFHDNKLFQELFNGIILQCINLGLISGEVAVADGSFLPANVSLQSSIESVDLIKQSTIRYLDELEEEMSLLPGYQKPKIVETQKRTLKSQTDPDCGYINQKSKKGLGYLTEMTIDTANGIVTGVDCYAANHRESDLILNHLKKQKEVLGYAPVKLALDGGYDVGAVHRGLELLGVDGYTAIRTYQNNALKKGFEYDAENDCFVCEKDQILAFEKLVYKKGSMNYYRLYKRMRKDCIECERLSHCQIDQGSVRINASGNYPAFHRNKQKYKTSEYYRVMRLRKIWAEGTFAVLKREHKLNKIQKRGIGKATEECLLSAAALNLKRMVKAL